MWIDKIVGMWTIKHETISQSSMKYPSKQNSKETLISTLIVSKTTSICVSMWWLDYENTTFQNTIESDYTLSFKKTLCQIFLTLPNIGMHIHTITLITTFWWIWKMAPVKNLPINLKPTRLSPPMLIKH